MHLWLCVYAVCIAFFQGHIKPLSQQVLTVKYLPCGPKKFHTSFQIQVSSFIDFIAQPGPIYGVEVFAPCYEEKPILDNIKMGNVGLQLDGLVWLLDRPCPKLSRCVFVLS